MERYTEMDKSVIYKGSTEDDEDSRHFVKTGRYATEEEATAQCIVYGQQIVDGKVPGSSLGWLSRSSTGYLQELEEKGRLCQNS